MTAEPTAAGTAEDAGRADDETRREGDEVPAPGPGVEPVEQDRLRPFPDRRDDGQEDRDAAEQQPQQ